MVSEFVRRNWAITTILAAFLILGTAYSIVTPIFETPDEDAHYGYVKHLADGKGLPVLSEYPTSNIPFISVANHPPLYYAPAALATSWIDDSDFEELTKRNPHAAIGMPNPSGNKNVFVHTTREKFPYRGTALAVHLLRFLSLSFGIITVLATYLTVREIFPGQKALALGAAAVNAFNPQFIFINARVGNDGAVTAFSSLAMLWMVKLLKGKAPIGRTVCLGLSLGAALLSKVNAIGLPILIGAVFAIKAVEERPFSSLLKQAVPVYSTATLVAGWWYMRNWLLYCDPLIWSTHLSLMGIREPTPSLFELRHEFQGLGFSFWAVFGWMNIPADELVYRILALMVCIAVLGLPFLIARLFLQRASDRAAQRALMVLLLWPAILFVSLLKFMEVRPAAQGRYLFPAISPISILIFLGLSQWLSRRHAHILAGVVGCGLFLLSAICPYRYIAPAYARPPILSPEDLPADIQRLDVNYGGKMRLLGYELEAESSKLKPGDAFTIVLYWQSLAEMDRDWSVFVHLLDEDGIIVAQKDTYPGLGSYPTSQWEAEDIVADAYIPEIPPTAFTPNRARLEVGLYDFSTGERLPIVSAGSELPLNCQLMSDNLRFGEIEIIPEAGASVPNPISFNFGDKIALIGYDLDRRVARPEESIHLTLYWKCLAEMEEDYTVFTHILGEGDQLWAQEDSQPGGGSAPTSGWMRGQIVEDEHQLTIASDAPPGVYDIEVGLYQAGGGRLSVLGEWGRLLGTRVLLSKVRVGGRRSDGGMGL